MSTSFSFQDQSTCEQELALDAVPRSFDSSIFVLSTARPQGLAILNRLFLHPTVLMITSIVFELYADLAFTLPKSEIWFRAEQ